MQNSKLHNIKHRSQVDLDEEELMLKLLRKGYSADIYEVIIMEYLELGKLASGIKFFRPPFPARDLRPFRSVL